MKIIYSLFLGIVATGCLAQQGKTEPTIYDEGVHVLSFEAMHYPSIARIAHRQGVVVVRVRFDSTGKVVSADALSGWKMLVPGAVENSRKWAFGANPDNSAIIVYRFRLTEGRCNSDQNDLFVFVEPNIANVTACGYVWQP